MTGFVEVASVAKIECEKADCYDETSNDYEECVLDTANFRTTVVNISGFNLSRSGSGIRLLSFHND